MTSHQDMHALCKQINVSHDRLHQNKGRSKSFEAPSCVSNKVPLFLKFFVNFDFFEKSTSRIACCLLIQHDITITIMGYQTST